VSKRCWEEKKNWGVTLAFASYLLLPTMSASEIGGEPAIIMTAIIAQRRLRELSVRSRFRMPIGYEREFSKMMDGIRINT